MGPLARAASSPAMAAHKGAAAAKRQRLTLAQLAAYDDMLTDALVDHVSRSVGRGEAAR